MLSSLFPCEFVQFIGSCFFCCFRVKDDHQHQINRVSQPITSILKEPVDSLASNCLWSVLVSEAENNDHSQCEDGRYGVIGSPGLVDELRDEEKFLKACGTLPQTHSQPHYEDTESTLQSWLPNTTTEKTSENQTDQLQSPIKLFTKWENGSDSSESCGG